MARRAHRARQPFTRPYEYVDQFRETIDAAEFRSIEICEDCGAPAAILCPRHAGERSADSSHEPAADATR